MQLRRRAAVAHLEHPHPCARMLKLPPRTHGQRVGQEGLRRGQIGNAYDHRAQTAYLHGFRDRAPLPGVGDSGPVVVDEQ